MKLPWKGGRLALVIAAAEDRHIRFFICCFATFGTVAFSFLNPQIIRYTIDSVIGTIPLDAPAFVVQMVGRMGGVELLRDNLWICALFILAAALLSAFCNIIRRYTDAEISETVAWRLHNILYGHIQKLPYQWHVSCRTGDIIQRCTSDIDNIRSFIQNQSSELLRTLCVFAVALVMMFSMDVFMSLMALSLVPLILAFSIMYFHKVNKEFARADEAEGAMQAAAQENYTGVQVVRAFGRESYEMEKFSEKTKNYQNVWIHIGKMLGVFWGTGDIISGFQLVVIIGAGVWRSTQGLLSPGTFLAFYAYCHMMIWPVRQLGRILADLSKTLVASERVRDILSAEPETEPADALTPELKGEICFNNVTFKYGDEEPILKNVSFTVKPGESLAILGATGSGKSTLVHLINRLYDLEGPSSSITIDGIDIRRIARPHLRRHVGLCLQEPFLFSKTIKENIALTKPEMGLADVRRAAAIAMVDETIEGFANTTKRVAISDRDGGDGYNMIVGERGVTLSGGQKQRMAIARMLATNAPIMIFDDSLSAVDTETDAKIRAALRKHTKNATVIIISHRISSLMQADKILILKDGMVEDIGSHEELMGRSADQAGSYRRIFELQRGYNETLTPLI